jgi:hypothetical protein
MAASAGKSGRKNGKIIVMPHVELDRFIKMQEEVRRQHGQQVQTLELELRACMGIIEQLFAARMHSSTFKSICRRMAGDPETPFSVLGLIAELEDANLQQLVAANPNAPLSVLKWFSSEKGHDMAWLRAAIAENPSTPNSILSRLKNDNQHQVAAAAKSTLNKRKKG